MSAGGDARRARMFTLTAEHAGERVDRVLAALLAPDGVSRSAATRLCDEGAALLDERPVRPAQRVRGTERLRCVLPEPEPSCAEPEELPLRVLFEDPQVLVVDKAAGMVVHPAKGHARGTLVNAVLFHLQSAAGGELVGATTLGVGDDDSDDSDDDESDDGAVAQPAALVRSTTLDDATLRPGIVHRLDRDTSGVLVVAKTARAREALKAQFAAHTTEREYLALVEGVPPERRTFATRYGRHRTDRKRFTSRLRDGEGKHAVTHLRLLEVLARGAAALVACRLETGRTHQIRVHASEHGYPLLGDAMYGRTPRVAALRPVATALGRQALHARLLGFAHPLDGRPLRFESPPPDDFAAALASLRALGA